MTVCLHDQTDEGTDYACLTGHIFIVDSDTAAIQGHHHKVEDV